MLDDVVTRTRIDDLQGDPGTGGGFTPAPQISATQTAATILTEDIGFGRKEVQALAEDYSDLHQRSRYVEWQSRTNSKARAQVSDMLEELADLGFAWRDLARLLDVSVAAVQKWRKGGSVTGNNRRNVATLLAACDLIIEDYGVQEIASWFEMPILADVPVTPMDLYERKRTDLVFEHASGQVDPEQVLTEFDSEWRKRYKSGFEVFRSGEGELSIRAKAR